MVGLAIWLDGCFKEISSFDFVDAGGAGDGGTEGDCPGQCVPIPPADWTQRPVLLWFGDPAQAPICPERAPQQYYVGHADLIAPNECDECTCTDPACVLPSGLSASNSLMCQGPIFAPLDTPEGWDGSCVAPGSVSSNQLDSLSFAPLTLSPCVPGAPSIPKKRQPARWGTFAVACIGGFSTCRDPGEYCVPSTEPSPPKFQQCIKYTGQYQADASCPGDYPESHIFYDKFDDARSCTPCTCGAAIGSECSALVSAYQDDGCSALVTTNLVELTGSICVDIAPGAGLASLSAVMVNNSPGTCAPAGGLPLGEAIPQNSHLFCCRSPP
jgi:hypothetical protein